MISIKSFSARTGIALVTVGLCLATLPAHAQDTAKEKGLMPPLSTSTAPAAANASEYRISEGEETHPLLRLTPDETQILRINEDATTVIVGNPAHLNVLMDNPQMLILVPRQPGATSLTLLNGENKVIMQRHVIVASPKEQYIRVRRSCINGGNDCAPTRVYYCPDMCHEVQIMAGQGGPSTPETISSSNTQADSSDEPPPPAAGNAADDSDTNYSDPDLNDDGAASGDAGESSAPSAE